LEKFLNIGVGIKCKGKGFIEQGNYAKKILERFDIIGCHAVRTPLQENNDFKVRKGGEVLKEVPYREALGMLQYIGNNTRPDIIYAANSLAQYTSGPGEDEWCAVKRMMRYLKGTVNMKLWVNGVDECLSAFCDADWGGDECDRKSVSGFVIMMGTTPVVWKSKKQNCISQSTQEAEFISLNECAKELMGVVNLLEEMGLVQEEYKEEKPVIKCDNTAAVSLAERFKRTGRSKHIGVRYFYVRDLVQEKKVKLEYVKSELNTADILTKSLGRVKFELHRKGLSLGFGF
jgi:hypothetical protein